MNQKNMNRFLGVFAVGVLVALTGVPAFGGQTPVQKEKKEHVHQYIVSSVEKIKGETVILKTNSGNRTLSVKDFEGEQISDVHEGDRFLLRVEEGNQIIDIDRIIGPGVEFHPEAHQKLKGNLVDYDREYKIITLKMANGAANNFKLKEVAATKMNQVKLGAAIEIEIDEENGFVNDFLVD